MGAYYFGKRRLDTGRRIEEKTMKVVYIPDGTEEEEALRRTTHLCISAHQDDIELMAYAPIAECFQSPEKWFCGVVTTDGAGSPRNGLYAGYTDEQMKAVRIEEQKQAAHAGEYGAQLLLGHPSKQAKDPKDTEIVPEFVEILRKTRPQFVYTHNLADKHGTHVATALKVIAALRELEEDERPRKVYGCEVWRNLDWLNDGEKVYLDCSAHPNLSRTLLSVFDSQITGGKRYDLAAEGRRLSNATFSESHACDTYTKLNYAMDLTPLMKDTSLDIADFVAGHIKRFEESVRKAIKSFV